MKGSGRRGSAQRARRQAGDRAVGSGRSWRSGIRWAGWLAAAAAVAALGCASAKVEEIPSAALYYSKGQKILDGYSVFGLLRSVDYPRAISLFQEVIDNYPFSEYAPLAELQIAEINEKMRKFEEAASFYQDFVELHPNHPRLPYALYRLGQCYISQMRDPDRDQDPTRKALSQLEFLTTKYPESEFAAKGKELLDKAHDQLALREAKIANFYYANEQYHAAVPRYRAAFEQSATHPGHCENRSRLGISLTKLGLRSEAETVLGELRTRCSDQPKLIEDFDAKLQKLAASATN